MGIVHAETPRVFKYLIVLLSVVAFGRSTPPSSIPFTCDANGIATIHETNFTKFVLVFGTPGNRQYCKPKSEDLLTQCVAAQGKHSLILLYEDGTIDDTLIGGEKPTYFKLNCDDAGSKQVHNTIVLEAKAETGKTTDFNHHVDHDFNLELTKDGTPVTVDTVLHIGDAMKLKMTGTDVSIRPDSCSTYKENDASNKIIIWEMKENLGTKVCTNPQTAIISKKTWQKTDPNIPDIEIELFAFRFENYAKVVIECTATVCAKTNNAACDTNCVTPSSQVNPTHSPLSQVTSKRKRRSIEIVGKDDSRHIRSSSVSFAVMDKEAPDNSSPGLSLGHLKFVTFGLVLLFVI